MPVAYDIVERDEPVAPALAAVPARAVVPPARLLDSVAAFTHHRDIDALDHALSLSLAELAPARAVVLYKRAVDGLRRESTIRCVVDAQGVHMTDVGRPAADPALAHCMDAQLAHTDVDARGRHRLFVPIVHEGRALGALQLEGDVPLDGALGLAQGFARIYANYTTLLNESERDKLTGLYNRRTFERHLERLFQQPPRASTAAPAVWLAIFDIDHFKRINDTWGHIYGDEVILLLAQQMRASFRQDDVLFRFGGEEFVVLLAGHDEMGAHSALERFRQRVAQYPFPQVEQVTVSIGYARASLSDYPETIIDRADKALYYAKQHGRNCAYGYEDLVARGALGPAAHTGSIDLF